MEEKKVFTSVGGRKMMLTIVGFVGVIALLVLNKTLKLELTTSEILAIGAIPVSGVVGLAASDFAKAKGGSQ
jgi:hypothetical protein